MSPGCFLSRSRRKMQTVSNLSIVTMLVMYLFSALFGYLTFYGTLHTHTLLSHTPASPHTIHSLSVSVCVSDHVEAELLHTFTKVYKFDTMLLLVRLAVLTAVTLTVPIVLFPVSNTHCGVCLMCVVVFVSS